MKDQVVKILTVMFLAILLGGVSLNSAFATSPSPTPPTDPCFDEYWNYICDNEYDDYYDVSPTPSDSPTPSPSPTPDVSVTPTATPSSTPSPEQPGSGGGVGGGQPSAPSQEIPAPTFAPTGVQSVTNLFLGLGIFLLTLGGYSYAKSKSA